MVKEDLFYQSDYWRARHEQYKDDPRSVGNLAASVEQNQAGEVELKSLMTTVAQILWRKGASALDLGCGYGRTSRCFTDAGFAYTGLDVSLVALEKARSDNPVAVFKEADLLNWHPTLTYNVVAALFVFVHFVDDAAWRKMVAAAALGVKKGGVLLIADQFPEQRQSARHYVARPFGEYAELLGDQFKLDVELAERVSSAAPGNSHARMCKFLRRM